MTKTQKKRLEAISKRITKVAEKHPLTLPTDDEIPAFILDIVIQDYISRHFLKSYDLYAQLLQQAMSKEFQNRGYTLTTKVFNIGKVVGYKKGEPWVGEICQKKINS